MTITITLGHVIGFIIGYVGGSLIIKWVSKKLNRNDLYS